MKAEGWGLCDRRFLILAHPLHFCPGRKGARGYTTGGAGHRAGESKASGSGREQVGESILALADLEWLGPSIAADCVKSWVGGEPLPTERPPLCDGLREHLSCGVVVKDNGPVLQSAKLSARDKVGAYFF